MTSELDQRLRLDAIVRPSVLDNGQMMVNIANLTFWFIKLLAYLVRQTNDPEGTLGIDMLHGL